MNKKGRPQPQGLDHAGNCGLVPRPGSSGSDQAGGATHPGVDHPRKRGSQSGGLDHPGLEKREQPQPARLDHPGKSYKRATLDHPGQRKRERPLPRGSAHPEKCELTPRTGSSRAFQAGGAAAPRTESSGEMWRPDGLDRITRGRTRTNGHKIYAGFSEGMWIDAPGRR